MRDRTSRVCPGVTEVNVVGLRVLFSCWFCRATRWLSSPGGERRRMRHFCEDPPDPNHYRFAEAVRLPCGQWNVRRSAGSQWERGASFVNLDAEEDLFTVSPTGRLMVKSTPSASPNPIQQLWRKSAR